MNNIDAQSGVKFVIAVKLKIIICFLCCLLGSVIFAVGQTPPVKSDEPFEFRELPRMTDGEIQGKTRKFLLKGFCRKTADCERFIVKKFERYAPLSGVEIYSVARDYHFFEFVLRYKNKSYITIKSENFTGFLKDYEILSKPDLLSNFLQIYEYFRRDRGVINTFYVIDREYLTEHAEHLKEYETGFEKLDYQAIHPPQIVKTDNGSMEIEFYADSLSPAELAKIIVIISPNYRVQKKSVLYRFKAPVVIE